MLLDAYALLAFLLDEPAADEVDALLRDRAEPTSTSAIQLGEVIDRSVRVGRVDGSDALESVVLLAKEELRVHPVDTFAGLLAGGLRHRYYDRTDCALSMADCVALATALRHEEALATSDPPLAATARALDIEVLALPDSNGVRP